MKTSEIVGRLVREASLLDAFGPTEMGRTLRSAAAILVEYEDALSQVRNIISETLGAYL